MQLQPLAARAQPDLERIALEVARGDALARLEAQLPAELANLQALLALPCHWSERDRGGRILNQAIAVNPKRLAVVLEPGAGAARGELLQHLDQLRLARRLETLLLQIGTQQVVSGRFLFGKKASGAGEGLLPLREALLEQRPDAAADEVARQRLVRVALVLDPFQAVGACVLLDRASWDLEQRPREELSFETRQRLHA